MRFEAKRLRHKRSTSAYFGKDGIQCFLDGRYARNDPIAGMLGYVQTGSPESWASSIRHAIDKAAASLYLRMLVDEHGEPLPVDLPYAYRSCHDRPAVGHPINIFHTFLAFNGTPAFCPPHYMFWGADTMCRS